MRIFKFFSIGLILFSIIIFSITNFSTKRSEPFLFVIPKIKQELKQKENTKIIINSTTIYETNVQYNKTTGKAYLFFKIKYNDKKYYKINTELEKKNGVWRIIWIDYLK